MYKRRFSLYFAIHGYDYGEKILNPLSDFAIGRVFCINNLREVTAEKVISLSVETKYLNSHNTQLDCGKKTKKI